MLRGIDTADCAYDFASDSGSPKGRELAANPRAALTWYWPAHGRQIRMSGPVAVLGQEDTRRDFLGRGERARVAAFTGLMSAPLAGPEEYARRQREARAPGGRRPLPGARRAHRLPAAGRAGGVLPGRPGPVPPAAAVRAGGVGARVGADAAVAVRALGFADAGTGGRRWGCAWAPVGRWLGAGGMTAVNGMTVLSAAGIMSLMTAAER